MKNIRGSFCTLCLASFNLPLIPSVPLAKHVSEGYKELRDKVNSILVLGANFKKIIEIEKV